MPLPACFHLADEVFPRVRAEAARRLVGAGWSQTKIASALAVSQAMVSKYATRTAPEGDALVLRLTDELIDDLDAPTPSGPSVWCDVLGPTDGRPGTQEVLDDLLQAERGLTQDPPLRMVPQIGLNIARAAPDATRSDRVLAFPGRLVAAGERLVSPVPPAWGASNHLAACLLALREVRPDVQALANVGADAMVLAAVARAGDAVFTVERTGDTSDAPVLQAFGEGHTIVHDPGAVGIEPCLYIAAPTAIAVADTIRSIHSTLTQHAG